jgi:hypothetical protein
MRTEDDLRHALSDAADALPNVVAPNARAAVARLVRRQRIPRVGFTVALVVVLAGVAVLLEVGHAGTQRVVVGQPSIPGVSCAARRPPSGPIRGAMAGTESKMVPGSPIVATVCRYAGVDQHQPYDPQLSETLVRSAQGLSPVQLAADLNGLKPVPHGQVFGCPAFGNGAADTVVFGYRDTGPLLVTIDLGGCGFATNGIRFGFGSQKLSADLTAEVGTFDRSP